MIRWIGFRIVTWHIFWEIGAKKEKLFEIKPPLQESRSDFKKKFFGPVVHSVRTYTI